MKKFDIEIVNTIIIQISSIFDSYGKILCWLRLIISSRNIFNENCKHMRHLEFNARRRLYTNVWEGIMYTQCRICICGDSIGYLHMTIFVNCICTNVSFQCVSITIFYPRLSTISPSRRSFDIAISVAIRFIRSC